MENEVESNASVEVSLDTDAVFKKVAGEKGWRLEPISKKEFDADQKKHLEG